MSQETIDEWEKDTPKKLPQHVKTAAIAMIMEKLVDPLAPTFSAQHGAGGPSSGTVEKTAMFGLGGMLMHALVPGGVHVAQNAAVDGLIRRPGIGKRLSASFLRGVQGKPMGVLEGLAGGLVGGAALPEAHMMNTGAQTFGESVNRALRSRGVTQLTARDAVMGRAVSQGDFTKLLENPYFHKTPAFHAMMQAAEKKTGVPIRSLISQSLYGSTPEIRAASRQSLGGVERAWKDPNRSPFTANVLSHVTDSGGRRQPLQINKAQPSTGADIGHAVGTLIGGAGTAMLDPATAALNVTKSLATNPTARNYAQTKGPSFLRKGLNWFDEHVFNAPIKERFQGSFSGGQSPVPSTPARLWNTYGRNSLVENMSQSAGHLGLEAGKGFSPQMKQQLLKVGP